MTPHTKAYDLIFEKRDAYLYACIKAPLITRAMAFDYLGEILDKCAAIRCKRLLIERDIPAKMPTADALKAIAEFVRLNDGTRTAFVNRHKAVGDALKRVIESDSANGGDVAYFATIRDAEEWLSERLPDGPPDRRDADPVQLR